MPDIKTDSAKSIKLMIDKLNEYRDAYYNRAAPIVSDAEYDRLYDELEQAEKATGIVMSNSPTQTVGYPVKSELLKVKHSHPMLSLAKTKNLVEFAGYCGNKPDMVSLKLDGLTCLLTYENGRLVQAETRGNGEIGELITDNAQAFLNIPLTIPHKSRIEIEGEAIITNNDFKKINSLLPISQQFSNPRNLVSGSVRQLDSRITASRKVRFVAWKVPCLTEIADDKNINNFGERLEYVLTLGFDIVPFFYVSKSEPFEHYINRLKDSAKIYNYPYDGFVHTYLDIKYGESLGNTGHHPRHSFVLKEQDEEYETVLRDIEWGMGKSGQLTPVAVFDPVDLDGAVTNKASVHNVSILTKLELNPGDRITVYRANMVIPQIKRNISAEERTEHLDIKVPSVCPVCGGNTEIKRDNNSDVLICTNPDCKGKLLGKLKHFCSKDAMDIQGLSEQTLQKFIDFGWLNTISDIYKLKDYKAQMTSLDGFGAKSVNNLLKAIEDSKNTTLDRFINALSIPNIGKEAAKTIAKAFDYSFLKFGISCNSYYNWQSLPDFGETMEKSIKQFWKDNKDWVTSLGCKIEFINPSENKTTKVNDAIAGKTFVITGKLNHFKNRDELVKKIEEYGGKVTGSVSKNTDYLINNDITSMNGKNKKAKELGVKIITESQFLSEGA